MTAAQDSTAVDAAKRSPAGIGTERVGVRSSWREAILGLAVAGVLAACSAKRPSGPPPAPDVTAITVQATEVPEVIELPGRIEAVRVAEVRAR